MPFQAPATSLRLSRKPKESGSSTCKHAWSPPKEQILTRNLSVRSAVSTGYSFAELMDNTHR